jgi:hypothetical protein
MTNRIPIIHRPDNAESLRSQLEASHDALDVADARRLGISVEEVKARRAKFIADDLEAMNSADATASRQMFNDWRDSDSELPYWAYVMRGCK